MAHSRCLQYFRYAAWVYVVLALLVAATQWIWDIHFARGNAGGIYWLVYLSPDIEPPPNRIQDASLCYDGTTNTLTVTAEQKVIYSYQP